MSATFLSNTVSSARHRGRPHTDPGAGLFCACRCSRLAHLLSAPHLLCIRPSGTMRPHHPLPARSVPPSLMQLSCPACAKPTEHRLLYSKNGCDILRCEQCGLGRAQASGFDPGTYYTDDYFSGGHADGYADYRGAEPVLRREFAKDAADYCREQGLRVVTGIADEGNLARFGKLDVIVLLDVIEHLPSPQETLALCARHLKAGGIIVITTGDFASP